MAISTAVNPSAVARVLGIETVFKNLRAGSIANLPQQVAVIGQGATNSVYPTTKAQYSDALTVGQTYGFGAPLHLAAQQLFPINGDGVGSIPVTFYPMVDDVSAIASTGDITPTGPASSVQSYIVRINNIDSASFVIQTGAALATMITAMVDAINAQTDMPVIAVDGTTKVDLTSKWAGVSANDIYLEVVGPTNAGVTFAFTQHTGGLVNPDIDLALAQVGDVWESMILNCLDIADAVTMNKLQVFGDGRWGALTRKPAVVFTGNLESDVNLAIVIPEGRKTDRINCQFVAPGSKNLPFIMAARSLARVVKLANENPPFDYGSQDVSGIIPGTDGEQWTYPERDQAVKAGSSTTEVKNGVINLSDTVTFYHPDGDLTPAYRYVVDIVKLQNILFNFNLEFAQLKWDGAPLIPDNQPTTNPSAVKPKTAVAAMAAIIDNLGLAAIISDPETAKASIAAGINGANPKRLDMSVTIQLSGNSNIISQTLNFGFFFGSATVIN